MAAGQLTLRAAPDAHGTMTLHYTISDGLATASADATVELSAVNDAPVAAPDAWEATKNASLTRDPRDNDDDVDHDGLTIVATTQPAHGQVSIAQTGVTYMPAPDYVGEDQFTYTISDGTATASAVVTLTVGGACGDGVLDPAEACDDANTAEADGCTSRCTVDACGDGIRNQLAPRRTYTGYFEYGLTGCDATRGAVVTFNDQHPAWLASAYRCTCTPTIRRVPLSPAQLAELYAGPTTVRIQAHENNLNVGWVVMVLESPHERREYVVFDSHGAPGALERAPDICLSEYHRTWLTPIDEVITVDSDLNDIEACDDGNQRDGDGCDATCQHECGNGERASNEACDDGNRLAGDGCDDHCQIEACGDGVTNNAAPLIPPELYLEGVFMVCDQNQSAKLYINDQLAQTIPLPNVCSCTPGLQRVKLNATAMALWQERSTNTVRFDAATSQIYTGWVLLSGSYQGRTRDYILLDYASPAGTIDQSAQTREPNVCNANGYNNTKISSVINFGLDSLAAETCDDGNQAGQDGCDATCRSECGDGIVQGNEACDDGNHLAGDGCRVDCLGRESCGDGLVDTALGETCDDGNRAQGDGCYFCVLEPTP